jgi:hypothetical protein
MAICLIFPTVLQSHHGESDAHQQLKGKEEENPRRLAVPLQRLINALPLTISEKACDNPHDGQGSPVSFLMYTGYRISLLIRGIKKGVTHYQQDYSGKYQYSEERYWD